ncbi:MAG: YajQ family cyclic di-GMP-binding protein [Tepidiformaceae bacterium]
MAKDETFDITTGADLQEVDNAVNQARKEISSRFDFKNVLADIDYDKQKAELTIHTTDEYKLDAIWQALTGRFIARNVPIKNLKRGTIEPAASSTIRQTVTLTQGIESDIARKIVKDIKEQKYKKVQAQIQGDAVRISGPSRDELQQVITQLKGNDYGIELKFGNYR